MSASLPFPSPSAPPAHAGWLHSPAAATLLALAMGVVTPLAFAPFYLWPLQIVTLAWLFRSALRTASIRRNALAGWAFGFGWAACGVHWLYISMHTYGGMAGWMAALAVGLLAAYLGLFAAAALAAAAWLRGRFAGRPLSDTILALLILPSLWLLSEWLRGWLLTGFPWLISGYAHGVGALAGYAPVLGVYGLGWLAALLAGALALLTLAGVPKKWPAILIVIVLALGLGLRLVHWTAPQGKPISVRLLQGNVPQEMKFSSDALLGNLAMYADLIQAAPADLIATPETAAPLLPQQLPPAYLPQLISFAQRSNSHLALGILLSDSPQDYANSVLGFSPDPATARTPYRYDKHHLVPFGEFIPRGFRWFVDLMQIPMGDMSRGAALQQPFSVRDQWVLPNICYEDLFGEEIAAPLAAAWHANLPPASILLNLSNIAWFGDSIALPQHLQISRMRALETGRPMLRATNTGATAVIGAQGQVLQELPPFTRGVLSAAVQGYGGLTPYVLLGNAPVVLIALFLLAFALLRQRRAAPQDSPVAGKTR